MDNETSPNGTSPEDTTSPNPNVEHNNPPDSSKKIHPTTRAKMAPPATLSKTPPHIERVREQLQNEKKVLPPDKKLTPEDPSRSTEIKKPNKWMALGTSVAMLAQWMGLGVPGPNREREELAKGAKTSESTQRETLIREFKSYEEWARQFSKDPEAGKLVNPGDPEKIANQIKQIVDEGFIIDRMVTGAQASDEDDSPGGGLGEKSEKNLKLAQLRADTFEPIIASALQNIGINTPIEKGLAEDGFVSEDILTPQEQAKIKEFAKHYPSVETFIKTYNRNPDKIPQTYRQEIDKMLAKERFGSLTLFAHRDSDVPGNPPEKVIIPFPFLMPPNAYIPERFRLQPPFDKSITPLPRPENDMRIGQTHGPDAAHHQNQPREQNFHKNKPNRGGRMERSKGGNRSGRRINS